MKGLGAELLKLKEVTVTQIKTKEADGIDVLFVEWKTDTVRLRSFSSSFFFVLFPMVALTLEPRSLQCGRRRWTATRPGCQKARPRRPRRRH